MRPVSVARAGQRGQRTTGGQEKDKKRTTAGQEKTRGAQDPATEPGHRVQDKRRTRTGQRAQGRGQSVASSFF